MAEKSATSPPGRRKLGHLPKHGLPQHRKFRLLIASLLFSAILLAVAGTVLRPRMAEELAEILPASWLKQASENVQATLDRSQLAPSQEPAERVETLAARFAGLAAPASGALPYRLIFRRGGQNGALTYALPDGSIIVTDELLALLPDDAQVLALLCHELGHLHYHHLLRASIENEFFSLGAATLLRLESQAVRQLERSIMDTELSVTTHNEADRFAQLMLEENGIPRQNLDAALQRLAQHASNSPTQAFLLRPPSADQFQARLRILGQALR